MLYTLTGISGSGKTTIAKQLFDQNHTIVSYTTRPIRPGEVANYDYYFVDHDQFQTLPPFIEHVQFDGNDYGITKQELQQKLANGNCVWIINAKGLQNLFVYPTLWQYLVPVFIDCNFVTASQRLQARDHNNHRSKQLANESIQIANIQKCLLQHGITYYRINTSNLTKQQMFGSIQHIIDITQHR